MGLFFTCQCTRAASLLKISSRLRDPRSDRPRPELPLRYRDGDLLVTSTAAAPDPSTRDGSDNGKIICCDRESPRLYQPAGLCRQPARAGWNPG